MEEAACAGRQTQTDRQMDGQTDRQADRQKNTETRGTGRQKETQTRDTDRQKQTYKNDKDTHTDAATGSLDTCEAWVHALVPPVSCHALCFFKLQQAMKRWTCKHVTALATPKIMTHDKSSHTNTKYICALAFV